jgi:hypothetical protein
MSRWTRLRMILVRRVPTTEPEKLKARDTNRRYLSPSGLFPSICNPFAMRMLFGSSGLVSWGWGINIHQVMRAGTDGRVDG